MKNGTGLLLAFVVMLTNGCGASQVPAGGTLTYKGKPVADANVTFVPKEAGAGESPAAATDASGKFTIDGVKPGDYTIVVSPKAAAATENDYSLPPAPPFPAHYSDVAASTLKVTVKSGSDNQFPLELKD